MLVRGLFLISNPSEQDTIGALLDAAIQAAHNVQDASFPPANYLALQRPCGSDGGGPRQKLGSGVMLLVGDPCAPAIFALCIEVAKNSRDRAQTGLPIPDDVRGGR